MATAVRSPGSTLKPFIYGLAFEAGLAHPETLIEDRAVRFGNYAPKNFDEGYHGTVTIREALDQSYNIPAVKVLAAVGPGKLAGRFRRVGVEPQFPDKTPPTLAMALGGVGLTLHDLATLYASLARGGEAVTLTHRLGEKPSAAQLLPQGKRKLMPQAQYVLSPVAAWYVTDILKDAPPPLNAKGGRFAYKTGTSYGYRDAWAVGYDGRYTIAVWVGRPDGAATPGLSGASLPHPSCSMPSPDWVRSARRCRARRAASCWRPAPSFRRRSSASAKATPSMSPKAPISSPACSSRSRPIAPRSRPSRTRPSCSRPTAACCRSPGSSTAPRSRPTRARARSCGSRAGPASSSCR